MNKHRWLIVGSMVLLLGAACVLNYRLSNTKNAKDAAAMAEQTQAAGQSANPAATEKPESVSTGSFFDDYKEERRSKRDDEIAYLDSVIQAESSSTETKQKAQQLKVEIVESMEKETAIETLLAAKGYEKAAVVFHEGAVNIVVGKGKLEDGEVAGILKIVMDETGKSAENVKIIPVE